MNIIDHTRRLAQVLDELLHLDMYADGGSTIVEIVNARAALQEWREAEPTVCKDPEWASAGHACAALGVSVRTLKRYRETGKITPALHWRRKGPDGHCVYNVPLIRERMNQWAR